MAKKKAVVVGRNYGNILATTRALGRAGYEVRIVKVFEKKPKSINFLRTMKPDKRSRYTDEYRECLTGVDADGMIKMLKSMAKTEKQLLFPIDDYSVYVVDENRKVLSEFYYISGIRDCGESICGLMNKTEQKRLASAMGIPTPQCIRVESENGTFQIPAGVNYPCFVKPSVSTPGTKSLMQKCDNRDELQKSLEQFLKKGDFQVLIEEYIDIAKEYSMLGISTNDFVWIPCLFTTKAGGHKSRKGVAITGETVECSKMQSFIDQCCEYVKSLNYNGLFDIDLAATSDGRLYFFEINFRAGASIHVFTQEGVNLPAILGDYLLMGVKPDIDTMHIRNGVQFVSEKVLLEEYVSGDIDRKQVREYVDGADVSFIRDVDDPKPYSYFKKYYMLASGMRLIYRVRNKLRKRGV